MRPRPPTGNGPHRRVPAPSEVGGDRTGGFLGNLFACLLIAAWVPAYGPDPQVLTAVAGIVGVLMLADRCRTLRECVLWLSVSGAVLIGYGYRWLAPTVQDFGGLSVPASWLVTALFGVAGLVHAWIGVTLYRMLQARGRRPHPMTTVAVVVAVEALPIRLFAWMVGHGAVDVPPLRQAAEWGGVSGVSFVLLCLVVPVYEWLRGSLGLPARPRAAAATFLVGAVLFGAGWMRYAQVRDEDAAASEHWRIGIVQANVGTHRKREAERRKTPDDSTIAPYERGSRAAAAAGAELIVWPETAITRMVPLKVAQQTNYALRRDGYGFLMELGRDRKFLIGLYEEGPVRTSPEGGRDFARYNSAALRAPGGPEATWASYRKVYLIPFGETVPLGVLEPFVHLPQNFEMVAGPDVQEPLETDGRTIVSFLCYEGILPDHVRRSAGGRHPTLLASLTNDSWFGDTWEPHQHLNFTRFRAVEHRAPMARATNTGISAFVDATGEVVSRLGVGKEGILVSDVPLVDRGLTPYVRFGHRLPWLAWAWTLAALLWTFLRAPPRRP